MTRRVGGGPRRTCLGCREVKSKSELVRLVRQADGVVRVDPSGSAPGRGAYVCGGEQCVEQAVAAGRLARAFRRRCEVGANLVGEVRELWQRARSR